MKRKMTARLSSWKQIPTTEKSRPSWNAFIVHATDAKSNRMFQMNHSMCHGFCERIANAVGVKSFKPETGVVGGEGTGVVLEGHHCQSLFHATLLAKL